MPKKINDPLKTDTTAAGPLPARLDGDFSKVELRTRSAVATLLEAGLDGETIVYAAFVSARTSADSITRAMKANRVLTICGADRIRSKIRGVPGLVRFSRPLPESCGVLTLCFHDQSMHRRLSDDRFYLVSHAAEPDPETFYRYLDKVSPLPMLERWSAYLWKEGLRGGWIKPLDCVGPVHCWRIEPDSRALRDQIVKGLRSKALGSNHE